MALVVYNKGKKGILHLQCNSQVLLKLRGVVKMVVGGYG